MLSIPQQTNYPQCEVANLRRAPRCVGYRAPDSKLCTYHDKLEQGLTLPPGDGGYFIAYDTNREDAVGTAILAHESYLGSSHPQFAYLIETGGMTVDGGQASIPA